MKKIIFIILLLTVTGCSKKQTVCTTSTIINSSIVRSSYIISHNNNIVYKLEKKEQIINKNTDTLNKFKSSIENNNREYNKMSHYKNKVIIKDDTLISITKINYRRLDLNKYVTIDKENKNIVSNNKVKLDKLLKQYKKLGLQCSNIK